MRQAAMNCRASSGAKRMKENCEDRGEIVRTERASRLPQREETQTQSRMAESRITPARTQRKNWRGKPTRDGGKDAREVQS